MIYFFKRKYKQIKNILIWIPILWGQFDFSYDYALDVFKFKLLNMADFLESDKAVCVGAKDRASRIRMVVRLMDKVYNEDYGVEYQDKLEKLFGKELMEMKFIDSGRPDSSLLKYSYELTETEDKILEIKDISTQLFKLSQEKQERAHKLLWALIAHNIRGWWD
jgi:hypothetical protein